MDSTTVFNFGPFYVNAPSSWHKFKVKCIDCFCCGITNSQDTLNFIYGNHVSSEIYSDIGVYKKDHNKYALNAGGNKIRNKIAASKILNSVQFNKTYSDTAYYSETKNILFIATIYKCQKTGLYKEYFENGHLKAIGNLINAEENGEWKFYNFDGLLNSTKFFKNGEIVKETKN